MQQTIRIFRTVPQASLPSLKGIPHWMQQYRDIFLAPLILLGVIGLWQSIIYVNDYPTYILPSPADVSAAAATVIADGTLWHHTQATLFEVLVGLAIGLSAATVMGYILAKSDLLEKLLSPYLVALQSIPIVAIAPLLIIWFGSGYTSKILVCALIVFFPALINTIVGLRGIDPHLQELMHSFRATEWQIFTKLELPAAMPVLLGGLKVSVTLSVIGAVVGEFVGANQGLGFLINQARGLFNTPLVFVAILTLVSITLFLYGIVVLLEKQLLKWRSLL